MMTEVMATVQTKPARFLGCQADQPRPGPGPISILSLV